MRLRSLGRARPLFKSMVIYFLALGLIFAGLSSRIPADANRVITPVFNNLAGNGHKGDTLWADKFTSNTWKELLTSTIPGLKKISGIKPPQNQNPTNLILYVLTGKKINDPLHFLKTEVPVMAMVQEMDSRDEMEPDPITEPPKKETKSAKPNIENSITSNVPLVAFYSTHSSETYEETAGVTHLKGKPGAVMDVAKTISEKIQNQYSIPTIFCDKLHDLSYNKSYVESEKTVKKLVAENKSLKMVFDIHRDSSVPKENTVTTIDGRKYAKILIIVGTDSRASHPKWRENLAFARKFAAKMDELYPGLSRGISVKQGRYNQQYHTSGLLLEVGSINNTTVEALNSASLVADVIVALLNEED